MITNEQVEGLYRQYDTLVTFTDTERLRLAEAQAHVQAAEQAQQRIQGTAQAVQHVAHQRLASIVTRCLQHVYGASYAFDIDWQQLRGKTEAKLHIIKDGIVLPYPLDQTGYGVLDVAAFALRLAVLLMQQPAPTPLLILDEPFKNVSRDKLPAVATMLHTVTADLGVQVVLVTHRPELADGAAVVTLEPS